MTTAASAITGTVPGMIVTDVVDVLTRAGFRIGDGPHNGDVTVATGGITGAVTVHATAVSPIVAEAVAVAVYDAITARGAVAYRRGPAVTVHTTTRRR